LPQRFRCGYDFEQELLLLLSFGHVKTLQFNHRLNEPKLMNIFCADLLIKIDIFSAIFPELLFIR